MKKPIFTAYFLVLLVVIQGCSNLSEPISQRTDKSSLVSYTEIDWVSSEVIYDKTASKRPLSILYFTDDVCSDGVLMESKTFLDSAVIFTLNSSYNCARISTSNDSLILFNDNQLTGNQLFKLYNLVGVPSILILDSENRYFGRIQADYYPSDTFLTLLDYYIEKQ